MSDPDMNLEQATESTLAKAATRLVMPVLMSVIAIAGGLILGDIRSAQKEQGDAQVQQGLKLQAVEGKVELMNAKVDNGLIWRITEIERRLNHVEQATKTP